MEKTESELIAEFMGGHNNDDVWIFNGSNGLPQNTKLLLFDKFWDWIMPVVQKIANLYANSNHDKHWSKAVNDLRLPILSTNINYVHKAVVEFIKWYNNTQKL